MQHVVVHLATPRQRAVTGGVIGMILLLVLCAMIIIANLDIPEARGGELAASRYVTVCCPDQQALDTAVALARLRDRRSLADHLRSFCSSDRPSRCVTVVVE
jgi:hypothetical protein